MTDPIARFRRDMDLIFKFSTLIFRSVYRLGVLSFIVSSIILGCSRNQKVQNEIHISDLVGVWEANYNEMTSHVDATGVETLIINGDGTYHQIYIEEDGVKHENPINNWTLDSDKVIHLKGGKWYPLGYSKAIEYAEGAIVSMPVKGKRVEVNLREEVLIPVSILNGEIVLNHLPVGDPDSLGTVFFHKEISAPIEAP